MAAVTQTTNQYFSAGNVTLVTATFTNPIDTNTWDTGLRQIFWVGLTLQEAAAAADAVTPSSISGGTVTLEIDGTVGSVLALAIGV